MRVAVSSSVGGADELVNQFFGRCEKFTIATVENDKISYEKVIDNPGNQAGGGAGIKAAQVLIDAGVDAVITGDCGPKAVSALKTAGITAYHATGRIQDALEAFAFGKLSTVEPQGGSGFR
jgi:predicted Fe-Mo cluster-binding NifX family protein